jgi:hypothetical protein
VIAICGVFCSFSRRIAIYLPSVWFGRAPTGLFLPLPTPPQFFHHPSQHTRFVINWNDNVIWICYSVQAFARLSAVYGGTYMLNKPECKVLIYVSEFDMLFCVLASPCILLRKFRVHIIVVVEWKYNMKVAYLIPGRIWWGRQSCWCHIRRGNCQVQESCLWSFLLTQQGTEDKISSQWSLTLSLSLSLYVCVCARARWR